MYDSIEHSFLMDVKASNVVYITCIYYIYI